jgi:hypothetical protein
MNKSLAAYYFKLSADQGHAKSQFSYGIMLFHGDGIAMNKSLAAYYFKLSADQGHAAAQFIYACCLFNGYGLPKDNEMGVSYLQRAADGGFAPAQLRYAAMLRHGDVIALTPRVQLAITSLQQIKDLLKVNLYMRIASFTGMAPASM